MESGADVPHSKKIMNPTENAKPSVNDDWRRTVIAIWCSQFLSIMGFSFAMPFAPYYIQQLGVTDPVKLKLWVSIFAAATPLTLAIFSPLWGVLADRYGGRLMLLRANFGATAVLFLMGTVTDVQQLVFLRLMQGIFTGTITAAQTMASVTAPVNRYGLVLGALSAAVFSGSMVGSFLGGLFSDLFGYRIAFFASGGILLLAALLVLFFTREKPLPTAPVAAGGISRHLSWAIIAPCLPILLLISAIAFVRQFDNALLPLLVQEILGTMKGAAFWTGAISAAGGVAGLLAGLVIGRLADYVPPPKIGKISALGAGLLMIPQGLAHGILLLFSARFGMIFCSGGLEPVFQIWLAKITPENQRGVIFGLAATARSVGWIFSPLVSGGIASIYGVRSIYFCGALLFLLLIPFISLIVRRLTK